MHAPKINMKFIKKNAFTLTGVFAAIILLVVEEIGDFFLLAPSDRFYIDIIISALLITAGLLLDINLKKLAKEKEIKEELQRANEALFNVNKELRESMSQIKVLRGLLPICASCKKIRDDKGYWQQVEVYIRKHSEADFTHGICPECDAKLRKSFQATSRA